jgi:hypothetical protein
VIRRVLALAVAMLATTSFARASSSSIVASMTLTGAGNPGGSTPYKNAVLADSPYAYWPMSTTSGTETDYGSGGNALTYVGSGTRGGPALTADTGAASYSPSNSSGGDYAWKSTSLTSWPSTNFATWEVVFKPSASQECNTGNSGGQFTLVDDWSTGSAFYAAVVADSTSCHLTVSGDSGNNNATQANGGLTAGTVYDLVFTYDKTNGIKVYLNGNSTPIATNTATYYAAWSSVAGPMWVGAAGSRSTNNTVDTTVGSIAGYECCVSLYSTELSTTRIAAHYSAL